MRIDDVDYDAFAQRGSIQSMIQGLLEVESSLWGVFAIVEST